MDQFIQFVMQHWALWTALAVVLVFIFINEFITQKTAPKMFSPAAAVNYINQHHATVIDIRPQDAFNTGHITHALNISADDARLEQYKNKPIILVCARGLQASTLANKLKKKGFNEISVLNGGMNAWVAANLPTIKGK